MAQRITPYLRYELDDIIAPQFVIYDHDGSTLGVYNTGKEALRALRTLTLAADETEQVVTYDDLIDDHHQALLENETACLECQASTGHNHAPECGSRIIGHPTVVADDCKEDST